MELLELISKIILFPSSFDKDKHGRKRPTAQWFLVIFLIAGIIWTLIEIQVLRNVESHYIFAIVLLIVSVLAALFTMYAILLCRFFLLTIKQISLCYCYV